MAIEFAYDAEQNRLAIRGKLTILHATEARSHLLERSGASLDLAEIDEIDGAGLQLLVAALRDAGMRLVAVSEAVADIVALTGRTELTEAGS